MRTAIGHANGWTAECPYCEHIGMVWENCSSPDGETVECEECKKEFQIEGIF